MKIAFFMHNAGAIHGAERATLDLMVPLLEKGWAVEAWLIEEARGAAVKPFFEDALRDRGVPVLHLTASSSCSISLIRQLKKELKARSPDILHTMGYKANVHTWLALGKPARSSVCWISTVHGWLFRKDWKEQFYGWLDLQAMKRADAVVALSDFYLNLLQQRMPQQNLVKIPSGLSLDDREALRRVSGAREEGSNQGLVFGMLGRLSEEKNHALFLDAVSALIKQRPGMACRFLVAGEGSLRLDLERKLHEQNLEKWVTLAGPLTREVFFEQVDVLVQCSRIENRPYTIMEAFAAGVPVIGTRVGGIPELISHEVRGLLIDEKVPDLVQAMEQLMDNAHQLQEMGAAAQSYANEHCRIEHSADLHADLYHKEVIKCS